MSLKGIELQIAIPKTFDAGKVAEQKQQQSIVDQQHANSQTEKQAIKNRETVLEAEEYAKLNPDDKENSEDQSEQQKKDHQEKEKPSIKHPYKGSLIDFSG